MVFLTPGLLHYPWALWMKVSQTGSWNCPFPSFISAWLCREMYHQEEDIVFLMALPDSVTAHASSAFCPHNICSLIPECDHLCFVISRIHVMLIRSGTLGLYMAMGLASGLLTGQCGLTLPPVPRHRARTVRAPAPWLDVDEPIQSPANQLPPLQLNDTRAQTLMNKQTNKQTQNHIILEMERPSRSPVIGVDSEDQGEEETVLRL